VRLLILLLNIGLQAMPLPPDQNDMRSQDLPPQATLDAGTGSLSVQGSPAVLLVTHPGQIPAALSQGKPVLIDIPAFQWRASLLATILKWGGRWLVGFLAAWWMGHWLDAQLPNKDYVVPDWAKFNFERRQPDNKVILNPYIPSPHEE
jgi:hypothetical protein